MMVRRTFIRTVAGGLLGAPLPVEAQQAGRVLRVVGWLDAGWLWDGPASGMASFRRRLGELGWVEGRNIAIVVRGAGGKPERLPVLAAELAELGVDVIVTPGTPATRAAKQATTSIPIVMAGTDNPVVDGLVASLAHPAGNVTGLTNNPGPPFYPKMAQLLKQAAPAVSRLAVLRDPLAERNLKVIQASASAMGLTVVDAETTATGRVMEALTEAIRRRVDGLFVIPTAVNGNYTDEIVEFARANRLPSISGDKGFVQAGGMLSYWTDWTELRRHSAVYVDKLLRGMRAADLAVEQPSKFELVINLKTAKAIGITIPRPVLLSANEVIE